MTKKFINPKSGKLNSNMRFNLKWNGTTDSYSVAQACKIDSVADLFNFDWIMETCGFRLNNNMPGPRVFLARTHSIAGCRYTLAVQPKPAAPVTVISSHVKYRTVLDEYKDYRHDLASRYKRGPGRPVKKGT